MLCQSEKSFLSIFSLVKLALKVAEQQEDFVTFQTVEFTSFLEFPWKFIISFRIMGR